MLPADFTGMDLDRLDRGITITIDQEDTFVLGVVISILEYYPSTRLSMLIITSHRIYPANAAVEKINLRDQMQRIVHLPLDRSHYLQKLAKSDEI